MCAEYVYESSAEQARGCATTEQRGWFKDPQLDDDISSRKNPQSHAFKVRNPLRLCELDEWSDQHPVFSMTVKIKLYGICAFVKYFQLFY